MTTEAAAPTDMEAALADARRWIAGPCPLLFSGAVVNLARCLLASSAEVAALREQVATLEEDVESRTVERNVAQERARVADLRVCGLEQDIRGRIVEHVDAALRDESRVRVDERARVVRALCHRAEEMGEDHAMSEVEEAFSGTPLAVSAALDFAAKWLAFHLADPGALPKSGAAPKMTGVEFLAEVRAHRDVFTPESIREVIDGLREFRDGDPKSGAADEREPEAKPWEPTDFGDVPTGDGWETCSACKGTGKDNGRRCEACIGRGAVIVRRPLRNRLDAEPFSAPPSIEADGDTTRAADPSSEPVERDPDDDSSEHEATLRGILACAHTWTPNACLIGNVRAGDIENACKWALAARAARTKATAPKDASK